MLTEKQTTVLAFIIAVLGIILTFTFFLKTPFKIVRTVEVPVQDTPVIEVSKENTLEVLKNAYRPSKSPLSKEEFSKSPKLFMAGSFNNAILEIHGTLDGNQAVFLLLNFANQGGIIKGERNSKTKLDLDTTEEKGGFFSKNPITTSVDLLRDTLGTISSEFERTKLGSREFNFIEHEQPSTISQLLVVPISQNGEYGGATITQLTIKYSCQNNEKCIIGLCEDGDRFTECINRNFGQKVMQEWMKKNGF